MKPHTLLTLLAAAALGLAGCDKAGQNKQTENQGQPGEKQAEYQPAPTAPTAPPPERQVAEQVKPPEAKPAEPPAVAEKTAPAEDLEQFMLAANQRLDELNKGIGELGDTILALNENAEANATIQSLREQREQVQQRFDELKTASMDRWSELKQSFESAMDGLEKAYQEANSQYRG